MPKSSSANRFYRWGYKGRFDEEGATAAPKDLDRMNEEARGHYYKECCDIIDILNQQIPAGQPKLRAPDSKFNRQIGEYAGQRYSVDGQLLSESDYQKHLKQVIPQSEDLVRLQSITKDSHWVVVPQESLH